MKKIIALVVALVMMAAMAVPAFAATGFNGGTGENKNQTLLSYGVSQEYVVTIPAALNLGENKVVSLSVAEGYAIPFNNELKITVASTNGWKLEDAENDENTAFISYDITDGEGGASLKEAAVLVAPANAASTAVSDSFNVALGTIPSIVATYTDYLTFTVTIGLAQGENA